MRINMKEEDYSECERRKQNKRQRRERRQKKEKKDENYLPLLAD